MATITHLVARSEERFRINLGGTRAVFDYCRAFGVQHAIFVGRHTYYGAGPEHPLYHVEEDPPMAATTFPELADLVAADLYAATALWRMPELTTTVLRCVYTLGPTGHGTLGSFLRGPYVPALLGFDPLFQFMHERDVVKAICLALEKRLRGAYNVAGPQPCRSRSSCARRGAGSCRCRRSCSARPSVASVCPRCPGRARPHQVPGGRGRLGLPRRHGLRPRHR
jgi:UDP-glucose 4-epimerase